MRTSWLWIVKPWSFRLELAGTYATSNLFLGSSKVLKIFCMLLTGAVLPIYQQSLICPEAYFAMRDSLWCPESLHSLL